MARGATIYRATLDLSLVDRNRYEAASTTIARHPSETVERMLVRLLAYALRHDRGLAFGRGVSTADEPDLWRHADDGRLLEWIEVGQPDAKRLVRACRRAERLTLFAFGDGADRYRRATLDTIDPPANLSALRLDAGFLRDLEAASERQLRWGVTLSGGALFVDADGRIFETTPEIWLGDPLA